MVLIAVVYQLIDGASSAFDRFGFAFVVHKTWLPAGLPAVDRYGAWTFVYGTLVTGICSVVLSAGLGVSIGLLLAFLAPRQVANIVGPLVEMLAAIPSVVLGLIGIFVICPFIAGHIEPWVHSAFGFLPIFGEPQPVGNSLFAASLVLTIMVTPIVAALTRDIFLTVPIELRDGAEALGATRWEMIRGVVLPTTQSGITAACVLGFGRAIGEAIAVSQVVGGIAQAPVNLFKGGYTLAGLIANEFITPADGLNTSAMFYLALILMVLMIATNLTAQRISRRFGRLR